MNEQQSQPDPIQYIRACKPDPHKWIPRRRGFIDWKFSELAEYRGFEDAEAYCQKMREYWHDYDTKYKGLCLLDISYTQYLNAYAHQLKEGLSTQLEGNRQPGETGSQMAV